MSRAFSQVTALDRKSAVVALLQLAAVVLVWCESWPVLAGSAAADVLQH